MPVVQPVAPRLVVRDLAIVAAALSAQIGAQLEYLPAYLPALAAALTAALLLARAETFSLLFLGIATASIVNFEPAPCDFFFAFFALSVMWKNRSRLTAFALRLLRAWTWRAFAIHTALTALLVVVFFNAGAFRYTAITFYLMTLFLAMVAFDEISDRWTQLFWAYLISIVPVIVALPWMDMLHIGDRYMAWFKDPNVLAAYLAVGILLGLAATTQGQPARKVAAWMLLAIALSTLFALTRSRGALLNLAAGVGTLLLFAALHRKHFVRTSIVSGIVLALASAVWLGPAQQLLSSGRVHSANHQSAVAPASTASILARFADGDPGRINNYRAGLQVAKLHPLGVGPGNYEKHSIRFRIGDEPFAGAAHSLYLRTLVEIGIPGLVTLVVFLGGLALRLRNWMKSRREAWIPAFFAATLAGMLVHSILIDTLHWRHLWIILALIAGNRLAAQPQGTGQALAPPLPAGRRAQ